MPSVVRPIIDNPCSNWCPVCPCSGGGGGERGKDAP